MNIYMHLETSVRELDSKLLLAVLAASRGHEVIISDFENIIKGLRRGLLKPGIFHTKSLTPSKIKIQNHSEIKDYGCKITSIDEEGGLVDYGYKLTAKKRYNIKTINQASAVFTWGQEDYATLKKIYPNFAKKIYKTGNPRVDLWRPNFLNYWSKISKNKINLKKPFVLIPTNFPATAFQTFYERMKIRDNGGYLDRILNFKQFLIRRESENFKTLAYFIDAVEYLSKNNNEFKIVIRPHPAENEKILKILFGKIPNVYVIRDDNIGVWISKCFAILHNGSTTALEAACLKKPIISYTPFKAHYERKLANDLGERISSLKNLSKRLKTILDLSKIKNKKFSNHPIPRILRKKIYIDEKEMASTKMLRIWESISNKNLSKLNNWFLLIVFLKVTSFKNKFNQILKKKIQNKINFKFPPFKQKTISFKIEELLKMLEIKQKLEYKILTNRTLLVRQKKNFF